MTLIEYMIDYRDMLIAMWASNNKIPNFMTPEDVYQDLAEKFLRMEDPEDVLEENFAGFIYTCAKNLIMDYDRKERGRQPAVFDSYGENAFGWVMTWDEWKERDPLGLRKFVRYKHDGSDWQPTAAARGVRVVVSQEEEATPEGEAMKMQLLQAVVDAVDSMEDEVRQVILLSFGFVERDDDDWRVDRGYTIEEISLRANMSMRTVRRRKMEGLRVIQEQVKEFV